jgi:hypothetical protein
MLCLIACLQIYMFTYDSVHGKHGGKITKKDAHTIVFDGHEVAFYGMRSVFEDFPLLHLAQLAVPLLSRTWLFNTGAKFLFGESLLASY